MDDRGKPPEDNTGTSAQNGSDREPGEQAPDNQLDAFGAISFIVAIAATIAALLAHWLTNAQAVAAVLFFVAAIAVAVFAGFTSMGHSQWFRRLTAATVVLTLVGAGGYFIRHHHGAVAIPPKPPRLSFALGSPAKIPWCRTYQLAVSGRVPAGYKIIIFDSAADLQYNFTGPYTFDGAVSQVPRVPGEFTTEHIFVGTRFATRNGRYVSNAGFRAVVIAAVVRNEVADTLGKVVAAPTGWGMRLLPVVLTKSVLDVVRNRQARHCLERPPP